MKTDFSLEDISEELLDYVDKYLKTVISNAKRRYYRKTKRPRKYGIVFVELDKYAEDLHYDEPGFEQALCQLIYVQGVKIPVLNPELADALRSLTETQRLVLLKNVVLKIPMKQIALELGVSIGMVEKHKNNAIRIIKRRMSVDEE
jgi:DNA-directed RNA polymerase specialized sigma24 family protein